MELKPSAIAPEQIKVRCTHCGEKFQPGPNGCPDCPLLKALVEDDLPSPDYGVMAVDRGIF